MEVISWKNIYPWNLHNFVTQKINAFNYLQRFNNLKKKLNF